MIFTLVVPVYASPSLERFSFLPTALPAFMIVGFLDDNHFSRVRWNPSDVLIFISQLTNDTELFLIYLFTFESLHLRSACSSQMTIFELGLWIWGSDFFNSLYNLDITPCLKDNFSHSVGCVFTVLMIYFPVNKLFGEITVVDSL